MLCHRSRVLNNLVHIDPDSPNSSRCVVMNYTFLLSLCILNDFLLCIQISLIISTVLMQVRPKIYQPPGTATDVAKGRRGRDGTMSHGMLR